MEIKTKIFADGADINEMLSLYQQDEIAGLTTNPTLMQKNGIDNYEEFALQVLETVKTKPVSFEVFTDDLDEMVRQGLKIASWAENVFVKVPIMNSEGVSTIPVIRELVKRRTKVNVTAIFTLEQVENVLEELDQDVPSYLSIFAGRIADAGVDPVPIMEKAVKMMSINKNSELIWASPREVLNIIQAGDVGCHIITITPDIINKIPSLGKNLEQFSLETVQMFSRDAQAAGFKL